MQEWYEHAVPDIFGSFFKERLFIYMEDDYPPRNPIRKRLSRLFSKNAAEEATEDEIISMVDEGHEKGLIEESEAEMIHNIFELDDTDAEDIMVHRRHVCALDDEMTLGDALDFMLHQSYSRYPVYHEDIDHIVGVMHIRDAMLRSQEDANRAKRICDLENVYNEAIFIPESQNLSTMFRTMRMNKNHMVIVVDEYGQTAGIVAMEDILEEIVGNIEDEHDVEQTMILQRDDGSFLLQGMADLREVGEKLGFEVGDDDPDTVNGLLIALTDRIPEDDARFEVPYEGYLFRVLSVHNKTIRMVLAVPQQKTMTEEEKKE